MWNPPRGTPKGCSELRKSIMRFPETFENRSRAEVDSLHMLKFPGFSTLTDYFTFDHICIGTSGVLSTFARYLVFREGKWTIAILWKFLDIFNFDRLFHFWSHFCRNQRRFSNFCQIPCISWMKMNSRDLVECHRNFQLWQIIAVCIPFISEPAALYQLLADTLYFVNENEQSRSSGIFSKFSTLPDFSTLTDYSTFDPICVRTSGVLSTFVRYPVFREWKWTVAIFWNFLEMFNVGRLFNFWTHFCRNQRRFSNFCQITCISWMKMKSRDPVDFRRNFQLWRIIPLLSPFMSEPAAL